ncbi:roadblock/LC7 domain-containing protein [candidate division KSB1 bacterium]|nr:roadblock/LC7 domain-containing protein [candidate division KSB1 bacterium]
MNNLVEGQFNPGPALSKAQFESVLTCLAQLSNKLRLTAVLLVDNSGRIMAQKSEGSHGDQNALATLAAGSYAAMRELAKRLGEKDNFKMVLHEGETHNIFISAVGKDHFLIVISGKGVAMGMVRLFTKRTIEDLGPILKQTSSESSIDQLFNDNFESLLSDELDRSLKEKE